MTKERPENPRKEVERIIPKLKHLPAFTDKYTEIWGDCSKLMKRIYPNQYVLVTKNFNIDMTHNHMSFITHAFMDEPPHAKYVEMNKLKHLLSKKPLETEGMFRYVERFRVEYNYAFKQLNAFTIIHDGEYAVLLEKPGRSRRRFTLPGGHVDFDHHSYQITMLENIRNGAIRELFEELNFEKCERGLQYLRSIMKPLIFVNHESDWNKIFHAAFIFECEVISVPDMFKEIQSGEPNRHGVSIVRLEELNEGLSRCKWLDTCGEYIAKRTDNSRKTVSHHMH